MKGTKLFVWNGYQCCTLVFIVIQHAIMSRYTANVIAHHRILDKGMNFIQKPFSREQLGMKVREVLDGVQG